MFNIFKRPFEKSSQEAWAKMSDDIAKVAILALPVMLYGKEPVYLKIINSILLLIGIYSALFIGRFIRRELEKEDAL